MKKIFVGLALCLGSSFSMAGTVCAAGAGTAVTGVATNFVKSTFTPKCSANTQVDFQQDASNAAVGSVSTKGNQVFGGHTNGGAVVSTGAYSGTTDAAALAAAVTAAGAKLADAGGSSG
jgi:hypothetical protein